MQDKKKRATLNQLGYLVAFGLHRKIYPQLTPVQFDRMLEAMASPAGQRIALRQAQHDRPAGAK